MVSKNNFVSVQCNNLSLDNVTMGFIACIRELKDGLKKQQEFFGTQNTFGLQLPNILLL